MGTNETNRILYFDLDLNSPDGRIRDRVGYIKDESEIASTFNDESSGAVFTFSEPLVVFDKKSRLFNRFKVTPYSGDIQVDPINNIYTSGLDTFIHRIVLVPYRMEHWGFVRFRAFVTTELPESVYRTMIEFTRLMEEYMESDEKVEKDMKELARILGASNFSFYKFNGANVICLHADNWDIKSLSDTILNNNIKDVLIMQYAISGREDENYLAYFNGEEIEVGELYDRYMEENSDTVIMDPYIDSDSDEHLVSVLINKLNCNIVVKMPNLYSE